MYLTPASFSSSSFLPVTLPEVVTALDVWAKKEEFAMVEEQVGLGRCGKKSLADLGYCVTFEEELEEEGGRRSLL
jgi:hypothetical protein